MRKQEPVPFVIELAEQRGLAPLSAREIELMVHALEEGERLGLEEGYRKAYPTQP